MDACHLNVSHTASKSMQLLGTFANRVNLLMLMHEVRGAEDNKITCQFDGLFNADG